MKPRIAANLLYNFLIFRLVIQSHFQTHRTWHIFPLTNSCKNQSRYGWRLPKWQFNNWLPALIFFKDLTGRRHSFCCLYDDDIYYFEDATSLKGLNFVRIKFCVFRLNGDIKSPRKICNSCYLTPLIADTSEYLNYFKRLNIKD